jgi:hypothetical protein
VTSVIVHESCSVLQRNFSNLLVFNSEKSRVSIARRHIWSPFLPVFAKVSFLLALDLRRHQFSSRFPVHHLKFSFVVFSAESPA